MEKVVITDFNIVKDKELVPQQVEAVKFMLKRTSAIVSLQTGLGKTLSSLTAMEHLKRALGNKLLTFIVAPPNALISFGRELENFDYTEDYEVIQEEPVLVETKNNKKRIGKMISQEYSIIENEKEVDDIVLISYSKVGEYLDEIRKLIVKHRKLNPGSVILVIFDEAHTLSNPRTQRTKDCKYVRLLCDICWGLTATPIKNSYEMLYHICNFIRPNYIANSKADFMRKFCEVKKVRKTFYGRTFWMDEIIGRKNEEQLSELLKDLIIYKERVYNIKYKYIPISLNEDELDMYDEVASDRLFGNSTQFSSRCIELQKLLDNCLEIEIYDDQENLIHTKDYKFYTKEDKLIKVIDVLTSKGHTPIIYTDFVDTAERLEIILEYNHKVHTIIGKTSTKKRKEIEDTIENGDVIIITSAGTASLNLQKANTVIFYNVPYSTVNVIQAIGRVTRLGSGYESQNVIFMYCQGTIDEYKIRYFKSNASMISSLLGHSDNLPDDLREMDSDEQRELKSELLWQYRKKKNKVRRARKKSVRENIKVIDFSDDTIETNDVTYNLTCKDIEIIRGDRVLLSKSKAEEEYGSAIENFDSIGFFKSKIREIFGNNPKVLKIYHLVTKEGKNVSILDNPKYKIGYYLKKYMLENWRVFEERLGR